MRLCEKTMISQHKTNRNDNDVVISSSQKHKENLDQIQNTRQ